MGFVHSKFKNMINYIINKKNDYSNRRAKQIYKEIFTDDIFTDDIFTDDIFTDTNSFIKPNKNSKKRTI